MAAASNINVLALVKGEERYVFIFDDGHRAEVLRTLGRFASTPDLSFTWNDAVVLRRKVLDDKPSSPATLKRIASITDDECRGV